MSGLKTYLRIRQHFWWPRVCSDVLDYVRGCLVCTVGQRRVTPTAPIQPHQVASYPFEFVAMDLLAMPLSKQGNQYACVIIDYFSRYAIVAPIPDKKAATIARIVMERLVLVHGHPGKLLTDQGGEFKNAILQELCSAISTKKVFTTPYRPQADGMAERFNRTLLKLLSSYVSDCQQEWDTVLPYVLYAYNTAFNRATGTAPFSVIFGKDPPAAVYGDVLDATGQIQKAVDIKVWKEDIKAFLEDDLPEKLRTKAREVKAKERAAINLKRGGPPQIQSGMVVVIANKSTALKGGDKAKLARKQKGLYVVVGVPTAVNVKLRKVADAMAKKSLVHVDLVQPVLGARKKPLMTKDLEFPGSKSDKLIEDDDEGDAEDYDVEEIRGMRIEKGHLQFLVRWKDYGPENDQWLLESELDCSKLVEKFVASGGDDLIRV